jgi:hypothetical protein
MIYRFSAAFEKGFDWRNNVQDSVWFAVIICYYLLWLSCYDNCWDICWDNCWFFYCDLVGVISSCNQLFDGFVVIKTIPTKSFVSFSSWNFARVEQIIFFAHPSLIIHVCD